VPGTVRGTTGLEPAAERHHPRNNENQEYLPDADRDHKALLPDFYRRIMAETSPGGNAGPPVRSD
jgi:hypothetical protein